MVWMEYRDLVSRQLLFRALDRSQPHPKSRDKPQMVQRKLPRLSERAKGDHPFHPLDIVNEQAPSHHRKGGLAPRRALDALNNPQGTVRHISRNDEKSFPGSAPCDAPVGPWKNKTILSNIIRTF